MQPHDPQSLILLRKADELRQRINGHSPWHILAARNYLSELSALVADLAGELNSVVKELK
jgi:hypothetical protein